MELALDETSTKMILAINGKDFEIADEVLALIVLQQRRITALQNELDQTRAEYSWAANPDKSGGWTDPNERHEMGG